MSQRKQIIKKHFDQSETTKDFQKDLLVLLWNKSIEKPSLHTKLEELWIGPYLIEKLLGYNDCLLKYMKGTIQTFPINGKHLKIFFSRNPQMKTCI